MIIEADLSDRDDLALLAELFDLAQMFPRRLRRIVWMETDTGIDEIVLFCQCNRFPACLKIGSRHDNALDSGFTGTLEYFIPIVLVVFKEYVSV